MYLQNIIDVKLLRSPRWLHHYRNFNVSNEKENRKNFEMQIRITILLLNV